MKRHIQIVALALFCLITSVAVAQIRKIKEAEKEYDNLAYIKATEILLEVANNGYQSEEAYRKLGNSFYFNRKMEEAAMWYGKLLTLNQDQDPEYYFRYAQALKGIEDYPESDKWMLKFVENKTSDLRARSFASSKDYLFMIDSISRNDIEISNLDINSAYSDFGTAQNGKQIVFATARGGGDIYGWDGQPYLDLYSATKNDKGVYDSVVALNDKINTKYHESTVAFMPDGKTMYFTRNNYYSNRYKKSDEGISLLKIFKATLNDKGDWDDVESIQFNSDDYSVAHPTINSSGTKMYFSSDMEGFGGADLFVVDIKADGTLDTPVNLGNQVNTEGSETFPFVNSKGDLYYSSNGFNGLGGLDIFVIRDFENRYALKQNLILENLGRPVNSADDDFGYFENLKAKEAFFTSNREGGKGKDDIYTYQIPECLQKVTGVIKDKETLELLPGALVSLFDEFGNKLDEFTVGENGTYVFENLVCNREYIVRSEKPDYLTDEKRFIVPVKKKNLVEDLFLEKDKQTIEPCDDLAKKLNIPIIYFDFDKWNIRYDAELELQKVLAVLNKFPTMTIAIKSHTDCRGSAKYNETLSDNRAKSTRKYLISKGIEESRIVAKGYGESKLLNDCACESTNKSNCSEAEHQLNRRSEFIITSMNGVKCEELETE